MEPVRWSTWFKVMESSKLGVGQLGKLDESIAYAWPSHLILLSQEGVAIYCRKSAALIAKCTDIFSLKKVLADLEMT